MLDRAAAQVLVDGLSAVALGAWTPALARPSDVSPVQARLRFAFGSLCLFYAARAAAEAQGWMGLRTVTLLIGCVLPVAALLLAEGVLRRHAPAPLKLGVTLGGCVTTVALLVGGGRPPVSSWGLGGYVILSLLGVAALILARDRALLSQQENAGATALASSGALLIALSVSDFLPGAFLGLSGVGAAVLAFILAAGAGSDARRTWGEVLVMVAACLITAAALAAPLHLISAAEALRLAATLLALLLAVGASAGAIRRRRPATIPALTDALTHADTSSLDRFLGALADQPLLAGLRIGEADLLADYDVPALGAMMAEERPVWTPTGLAEPHHAAMRAHEELADLMAKTQATHAMMVARSPLRIALLTLPDIGPASDATAQLALFGKLAALVSERTR